MSKKVNITATDLLAQFQENNLRINEIADLCEKENRQRTEAEEREYRSLTQKNSVLSMRMQTIAFEQTAGRTRAANIADAERIIRDNINANRPTSIIFSRSSDPDGAQGAKLMMIADATTGGIIPITIEDFVKPIQEKTIYDKLPGLQLRTGLVGDFLWPTYETVEATLAGEGVKIGDTEIPLNKVSVKPERIALAVPATRESLTQTDGALEFLIKTLLPMAVTRLVNKILIKPTKVNQTTLLKGPFVDLNVGSGANATPKIGLEPAFADFNAMKGALLDRGVEEDNLCWAMTASQKCIAECTPKDSGSGIMVCENNTICGLPVFTCSEMSGFVGLGDWRYQPAGFFGEMSFTIDPYTLARKGSIDFVVNADFATVTTSSQAFYLGKVAAKE